MMEKTEEEIAITVRKDEHIYIYMRFVKISFFCVHCLSRSLSVNFGNKAQKLITVELFIFVRINVCWLRKTDYVDI